MIFGGADNPSIQFIMPDSNVELNASYEEIIYENFIITKENRSKIGYTGNQNQNLIIPATFEDLADRKMYKVVEIGEYAFNMGKMKSLTIPITVVTISAYAFGNCSFTRTINIPNSVINIASNAFTGCAALTINIDKPKDSISGAPWGGIDPIVNWLG